MYRTTVVRRSSTPTRTRTAPRSARLATLAVNAALLATIGIGSVAVASPDSDAPRVARCFPAAAWGGNDGERPCVAVKRIYEDGSFEVAVSDANGTVRYTTGVGALDR